MKHADRDRIKRIVLLSALAACGMASTPQDEFRHSLDEYRRTLRTVAGNGARNCGFVKLKDSTRAGAIQCANGALASSDPFFVAFQMQGIDTIMYFGLARPSSGRAEEVMWGTDTNGGRSRGLKGRIVRKACERPAIDASFESATFIVCGDK